MLQPKKRTHVTGKCPNGHSAVFLRAEIEELASAGQLKQFDEGKRKDVDIRQEDCSFCNR